MSYMERLLVKWLLVSVISNTNGTIQDKVHLEHLFLLVVDHVLFLFVTEVAGFKSKSNIIEELAFLVLLRVEEESEVVEYVVKQIVDDNSTFDLSRKRIDELIVFLNLAEAIVCPEILEMLVDLPVK